MRKHRTNQRMNRRAYKELSRIAEIGDGSTCGNKGEEGRRSLSTLSNCYSERFDLSTSQVYLGGPYYLSNSSVDNTL